MKRITMGTALLVLAACGDGNVAPGNDAEAAHDRPARPAVHMRAGAALAGVEADAIQPETMSDGDIATVGGARPCAFKLTRAAFPSLLYGGSDATIKLNGKLVALPRTASGRYEDAGLRVTITPDAPGSTSPHVLQEATMILWPPGTRDERGYRGFAQCVD